MIDNNSFNDLGQLAIGLCIIHSHYIHVYNNVRLARIMYCVQNDC